MAIPPCFNVTGAEHSPKVCSRPRLRKSEGFSIDMPPTKYWNFLYAEKDKLYLKQKNLIDKFLIP
jgi:hypothetical protein